MQVRLGLLNQYLIDFEIEIKHKMSEARRSEQAPILKFRKFVRHLNEMASQEVKEPENKELSSRQIFALINLLFSIIERKDSFSKLVKPMIIEFFGRHVFYQFQKLQKHHLFTIDLFNKINELMGKTDFQIDQITDMVKTVIALNKIQYLDAGNMTDEAQHFLAQAAPKQLVNLRYEIGEIKTVLTSQNKDLSISKKLIKIMLTKPEIVKLGTLFSMLNNNGIALSLKQLERITQDVEDFNSLYVNIDRLIWETDPGDKIPNETKEFIKILLDMPEHADALINLYKKFQVKDRSQFVELIKENPLKFLSHEMKEAIELLTNDDCLRADALEVLSRVQDPNNLESVAHGLICLIQGDCFGEELPLYTDMILHHDGEHAAWIAEAIYKIHSAIGDQPNFFENPHVRELLISHGSRSLEVADVIVILMRNGSTKFQTSFEENSDLFYEILAGLNHAAELDRPYWESDSENIKSKATHIKKLVILVQLSKYTTIYTVKANRDMIFNNPNQGKLITDILILTHKSGMRVDAEVRKKINENLLKYDSEFSETLEILNGSKILNQVNFYNTCNAFVQYKSEFHKAVNLVAKCNFLCQETFDILFAYEPLKRAQAVQDLMGKKILKPPAKQYPHLREALELAQIFREANIIEDIPNAKDNICTLAMLPKPIIREGSSHRLFSRTTCIVAETKSTQIAVPVEEMINAFRALGKNLTYDKIEKLFSILKTPEKAKSILEEILNTPRLIR